MGIVGSRQAGKSTLAMAVIEGSPLGTYISLDDAQVREAAAADPAGFVTARPGLLAIDEIQRVPHLLHAIKAAVDRDTRPGHFLITGSSQPSANRGVAETLSGRIERLTLWPFTQDEFAARRSTFLDRLLTGDLPPHFDSPLTKRDYLDRALAGGFAEAREIRAPKILITDPGLAGHLRHADIDVLTRPELRDRAEVDLIVEAAGRIAAVEIKAGSAADATAIRNLILLRDQFGEQFTAGVVLHTG